MPLELLQIDAFTSEPFSGNPAAICLLDTAGFPDVSLMQSIALEMNLSETAFVALPAEDGVRPLRWFTPTVEVELCGHATLASAHALWERGGETASTVVFSTRSGELSVTRTGDDRISLDLPADPPVVSEAPEGLLAALGCDAVEVAAGRGYLVVRVADPAAVAGVDPNMAQIARFGPRGIAVTAAATAPDPADFVSRVFVPSAGVPEDPVTGSAHCVLGPFWAERLGLEEMTAHQVSARGGRLQVVNRGERVELVGRAVTVAEISLI